MRQSLPKSLRFDVLKRDAFKCQYCGAEAPAVLLHVDHIEPVSKGGTNDITNLITACEPCNLGKTNQPLSDNIALQKSRSQLDELQSRREQLELMMEWRKGLRDLSDEALDSLVSYWDHYAPGRIVTDAGRTMLAKLLDKFSVSEICAAMDSAALATIELKEDGTAVHDTVEKALNKIGGICRVNRASLENPELKDLYYIRGILRNRITGYFKPNVAMDILKDARRWNVPMDDLRRIAMDARSWSHFTNAVDRAIARYVESQP